MKELRTSVLILAAGFSSRMGSQKFSLKLPDGRTFLESLIRQYLDFGCEKIAVVLNRNGMFAVDRLLKHDNPKVIFVENPSPESGRFLSISLGLKSIDDGLPVFIQNIDNPFAPVSVLEMLRSNLSDFDFVKPVFEGKGGHPVLIGPVIVRKFINDNLRDSNFNSFLERFHGRSVDVENAEVLININTKEDYQELLSDFSFKK